MLACWEAISGILHPAITDRITFGCEVIGIRQMGDRSFMLSSIN
jgi:hypothetical protein